MDVLELPRPVINFLRTMAKEGCRYVLSWDIFGGTDAVTLSLTWKLNDDQSPTAKSPEEKAYGDLHMHHNDSISSSRRSRRDQNQNISTSAIFRSSRGKSLEDRHSTTNKSIISPFSQVSNFERSSIIHRGKKESDPVYANLSSMKSTTIPSSSLSSTNNPQASIASKQQYDTPIPRKITASTPMNDDTYSKLKRINPIVTRNNDDDDDTLDPWVKRFECSLDENTYGTTEDDVDQSATTSTKVKFKRKPDYFE